LDALFRVQPRPARSGDVRQSRTTHTGDHSGPRFRARPTRTLSLPFSAVNTAGRKHSVYPGSRSRRETPDLGYPRARPHHTHRLVGPVHVDGGASAPDHHHPLRPGAGPHPRPLRSHPARATGASGHPGLALQDHGRRDGVLLRSPEVPGTPWDPAGRRRQGHHRHQPLQAVQRPGSRPTRCGSSPPELVSLVDAVDFGTRHPSTWPPRLGCDGASW
jgi:hypothetical protein